MDTPKNTPSSAQMARAIQRRFDAEESIAVFWAFVSSLLNIIPDERDRAFDMVMMAGEMANLPFDARAKMLATTDGTA